jgi:hypothetical protein
MKYDYSKEEQILEIKFTSGAVYRYLKIPESLYEQFRLARSKGVFFNEHIKQKFEFEKSD